MQRDQLERVERVQPETRDILVLRALLGLEQRVRLEQREIQETLVRQEIRGQPAYQTLEQRSSMPQDRQDRQVRPGLLGQILQSLVLLGTPGLLVLRARELAQLALLDPLAQIPRLQDRLGQKGTLEIPDRRVL